MEHTEDSIHMQDYSITREIFRDNESGFNLKVFLDTSRQSGRSRDVNEKNHALNRTYYKSQQQKYTIETSMTYKIFRHNESGFDKNRICLLFVVFFLIIGYR